MRGWGLVFVLACLLFGAAPARASSPHAFKDDRAAELASDGAHLWLAVIGSSKGELSARVYRKDGAKWRRLPRVPRSPGDDRPSGLTEAPPGAQFKGPCLWGTSGGRPLLTCREGPKWRRLGFGSANGRLTDVRTVDGQLVALFANRAGRELTVLKRTPGGWTQSSEPISTGGPSIASLGQGVSTASEQIDVLVEHGNPVKRTVWSLDGADWIAGLPLEGLGDGPQVGGAVRTDGSLLIPVVDAARRVWPFSVYDYSGSGWAEVGGAPLNVGRGSAQGRLDLAGETAWAIWQEHRWRGGLFRTRIFTASFNGDEFRRPFEP